MTSSAVIERALSVGSTGAGRLSRCRRPLVVGNWKMSADVAQLSELPAIATAAAAHPELQVVICPPAPLLQSMLTFQPNLASGAQDCHDRSSGPFTGCTSPALLREIGTEFVLVGHSERRRLFGETNAVVRAKAMAATQQILKPIICVGESASQRSCGRTNTTVSRQTRESMPPIGTSRTLIVAYEPVWAIGSRETPSVAEIASAVRSIRREVSSSDDCLFEVELMVLYGGSVAPDNVDELLSGTGVDGLLVGGASQRAKTFVPIIEALGRFTDKRAEIVTHEHDTSDIAHRIKVV